MIDVLVPATTANVGPGFDCLGAALTLHNRCGFALAPAGSPALAVTVSGAEAGKVDRGEGNLIYQALRQVYTTLGQPVPLVQLTIALGVPLARGLGSSATAIVAGLVGGNALAGNPLSSQKLMELAIAMEGHPDNVVPALLGGCRLAAGSPEAWQIASIPWPGDLIPVVAIPDFELSTAAARSVLPASYSRADAVFNVSRLGLLLQGIQHHQGDWLREALQDRIHQPYRRALIPGYEAMEAAAIAAGAYGLVISGAGPTLLALCSRDRKAAVIDAMDRAWRQAGITPQVHGLAIDQRGAHCLDV